MYSLCSEGMNNSPCHTKSHWESDICSLVCFWSVPQLTEPLSHVAICFIVCLGGPLETVPLTADETSSVTDMSLHFLFLLERYVPVISLPQHTLIRLWFIRGDDLYTLWAEEAVIVNCWHVNPARLPSSWHQRFDWSMKALRKLCLLNTWKVATHMQALSTTHTHIHTCAWTVRHALTHTHARTHAQVFKKI